MLLFSLPTHEALATQIGQHAGLLPARVSIERFPNGEVHIRLGVDPRGQQCWVVGTIAPPAEQLIAYALLCDTLKRQGATQVMAVLPYLAYARQDKLHPHESVAAAWTGTVLKHSGVDHVITMELHNQAAAALVPLPIVTLSAAPLFTRLIKQKFLPTVTIVAPDEGARELCQRVALASHLTGDIAVLRKIRTPAGIRHTDFTGKVGRQAIIIDDLLDTGHTILSCCQQLRKRGAEEITIMVTHGLFTGQAWRAFQALNVKNIYSVDTIPTVSPMPGVTRLSCASLLAQALAIGQSEAVYRGHRAQLSPTQQR